MTENRAIAELRQAWSDLKGPADSRAYSEVILSRLAVARSGREQPNRCESNSSRRRSDLMLPPHFGAPQRALGIR
jgi:hypothetical protein